MSWFVIGYYTLLLGGSCLAAYFNKRSAFLLLFSLTLVSFVLGIVGGTGALRAIAICAAVLALAAMVSYAFREFLIALASEEMAKELPPLRKPLRNRYFALRHGQSEANVQKLGWS